MAIPSLSAAANSTDCTHTLTPTRLRQLQLFTPDLSTAEPRERKGQVAVPTFLRSPRPPPLCHGPGGPLESLLQTTNNLAGVSESSSHKLTCFQFHNIPGELDLSGIILVNKRHGEVVHLDSSSYSIGRFESRPSQG